MLALKVLAEAHPVVEPTANLVARSRLRLEEALDALPPKRWYERLGQRMMNNFASLQAAPVAACLLLVVGAGAAVWAAIEFAQNRARRHAAAPAALAATRSAHSCSRRPPAEIANISSIVRQPNSEMVEVSYNQVVPQQMQGSLDDPADSPVADAGQSRTRPRRGCATIRWGCWRPSAGPGTVARRRGFAMR